MSSLDPHPGPIQTTYGIAMPIYLLRVSQRNASRMLAYIARALKDINCTHWEVTVGRTVEGDAKLLIDPDSWCAIIDLYKPVNTYETWVDDRVEELIRKLDSSIDLCRWGTKSSSPESECEYATPNSNSRPSSSLSQRRMSEVLMRFHPKRILDSLEARTDSRLRKVDLRHKYKLVVFNGIPMLVYIDSEVQDVDAAACKHLLSHVDANDASRLDRCQQKLREVQRWEDIFRRLGDSAATNVRTDPESSSRLISSRRQSKVSDFDSSQRRTSFIESSQLAPSQSEPSRARSSHSRASNSHSLQHRVSQFDFDDSLLQLSPLQAEASGALQSRPESSVASSRRDSQSWGVEPRSQSRNSRSVRISVRPGASESRRRSVVTVNIRLRD